MDAPLHQSHMDEQQAQGQLEGMKIGGQRRMRDGDKRGIELLQKLCDQYVCGWLRSMNNIKR